MLFFAVVALLLALCRGAVVTAAQGGTGQAPCVNSPCSLLDGFTHAVASSGNTLVLLPGLYDVLSVLVVPVGVILTVKGSPFFSEQVSLRANSSSMFRVSNAAVLSLAFLSIVDSGNDGIASSLFQVEVQAGGSLAVESCVFRNNTALSEDPEQGGAAIFVR